MIVDCHTHINFDIADDVASEHPAQSEAVDSCIVLADADGPSEQVNKKLAEYVGRDKEKMVGFALVEPTKDDVSVKGLTRLAEKLGLSGIVLHCSTCGFHPAHSRAMQLYESAQQLSLAVFFHNGGELKSEAALEYARPYLLDEVARQFDALKIVIGTMGMPFVEQTLSMAAKHKNVYADLTIRPNRAWQVYNTVVAAYESGVMNKLLFGSGYPLGDAGGCIETLLGFNKLLADTNLPTVPRGEIKNIIERNSLKLLGIK